MNEKIDSKGLSLATVSILGQPPSLLYVNKSPPPKKKLSDKVRNLTRLKRYTLTTEQNYKYPRKINLTKTTVIPACS